MVRKYLVLFFAFFLLACNDDNSGISDLSVSIRTLDKFEQPVQTFIQEEPISIELTLINNTPEDVLIAVSTGSSTTTAYAQKYAIKNSDGVVIWSRVIEQGEATLPSSTPIPVDFPIVLNSMGSSTQIFVWNQVIEDNLADFIRFLPIGFYTLEGSFPNIDPEIIATSILRIR